MGCWVSKNKTSPSNSKPPHISKSKTHNSKSPPGLEEEETVKEVLTETPSFPKHFTPPRRLLDDRHNQSAFITAGRLRPDFKTMNSNNKRLNGAVPKIPHMVMAAFGNDDVSEETYSNLSESASISATLSEKKGNNEFHEIRQRSPARSQKRSFSGEVKRETAIGKSPARRYEPSPGRARPGTGPVYGRRKDSGESSGRRSKSPVTRADSGSLKTNLGRCQSARKTCISPGRVGSGPGDRIRKLDEGKENGGDHKLPPTTSDESLENPLVSLECFIFL